MLYLGLCLLFSQTLTTNEIAMYNSPTWLKRPRVEQVTNRIQQKLEWRIRKVDVHWHSTMDTYLKVHNLGPKAVAVTKYSNEIASIHLGPNVQESNFNALFGHELVHVILYQKYKTSIPKWFEEGLANHLSQAGKVDYKWLATQPNQDVYQLAHPFSGDSAFVSLRYKSSQALAEMLDKKCKLENLIRLSVERKMEDYIKTYCEIKDLNQAFQAWIRQKAAS
jgi:hypothetical protein